VLFTGLNLFANNVDSLESLLSSSSRIEKVDILNQLAWSYKSSKPETAVNYSKESITLAESIDYNKGLSLAVYQLAVIESIRSNLNVSDSLSKRAIELFRSEKNMIGIAKCWNILGINQNTLGKYQESTNFLNKALKIFEEFEEESAILAVQGNIGNIYYSLGKYDTAIIFYNKLLEYSITSLDTNSLLNNLRNVGIVDMKLSNYAKALDAYFKILEIARLKDDSVHIARVLNDISITFRYLEMADEAIESMREAIEVNKRINNRNDLANNYNNIGNAFKINNELDSALTYYRKSKNIYKEISSKAIGTVYTNIGILYKMFDKIDSAEIFHKKAIEFNTTYERDEAIARDRLNLASVYYLQGKYSEAESLWLLSFAYWKENGLLKDLALNGEYLSELYQKTGKNELALKYRLLHEEAEDSIFSREKQNELTRLLIRQKVAENKSIFQSIKKESMLSKYAWIVSLLLIGSIGLVLLIYRKIVLLPLKFQLLQKDRKMAFNSLSAIQKDQFILQFTNALKNISEDQPDNDALQELMSNVLLLNIESNSWENFKSTFEQMAPHFFNKLLSKFPSLTDNELRLCAMIRLNIPVGQMSQILGISNKSVNMAKYRLRKRLKINGKRSLENFMISI